jgi:hypothetical protein
MHRSILDTVRITKPPQQNTTSRQTRATACTQPQHSWEWQAWRPHSASPVWQCRDHCSNKQRVVLQSWNQQNSQARLCLTGPKPPLFKGYSFSKPFQHFWRTLSRCDQGVPGGFPFGEYPSFGASPRSPIRQIDIIVAPASAMVSNPLANDVSPWNLVGSQLQLNPSPLQPNCWAEDHFFMWKGINSSPATTIDHPAIRFLAKLASQASLRDASSYGSGLQKLHLFCDVFSMPEADQLPASFPLLHSFIL